MATTHLLGTGAALSDKDRTTTMLAVQGRESLVLIDCGGDAAHRLLASDLPLNEVTALIVTHEHADHAAGFPLLMERLWLAGIGDRFDVYGIAPALSQVHRIHEAFDTSTWPRYPTIAYHQVEHEVDAVVLETDDLLITSSPGRHAVPVVGLRVVDKVDGGVMAYSCDTERSDTIAAMARGADLLIHEATGAGPGHSSSIDAAHVAAEAGVSRLALVHLPPARYFDVDALVEARRIFPALTVGADGDRYDF
ncbi:MAG TPA: MBL fold metallo-hydrolase [Trueperaceae bacterium]|nr:MBL fold metallo-hydrolase [Trueperaceae bacterium]